MSTKYDTVIFDLGKVVIDFNWRLCIERLEHKVPKELDFSMEMLANSKLLHEYERGEITRKKFNRDICNRFGNVFTTTEFDEAFNAIFTGVYSQSHAMLQRLQGNVQLLALTNINDAHYEYCWEHYEDTLLLFDHVIASHEVGKRKPEKGIFKHVKNKYEIEVNSTIYLDDLVDNIEAGREFGFNCIWVKNIDIALQELDFMLV